MIRLLSDAEIITRLKTYYYGSYHKGPRQVPIAGIARLCGLNEQTLFDAMKRGGVTERNRQIVSTILLMMEEGYIEVKPQGVVNFPDPPAELPPPQDKIVRAEEWQRFAPCRTCSGTQWGEAWNRKQAMRICLKCVPENQWKALHLDTELNPAYKPKRKRVLTNWLSSANSSAATAGRSSRAWRRPKT